MENRKNEKWSTRRIILVAAACILILVCALNFEKVAGAIGQLMAILSPLVIGVMIALIINVPMRAIEDKLWKKSKKPILKNMRRPVAFLISLILILVIVVGVVALVIPELIKASEVVVAGAAEYAEQLNSMDEAELAKLPFGSVIKDIEWEKLLGTLQSWLKNQGGAILTTAFNTVVSIVGGIYNFFIALIFAVYIILSKDVLKAQAKRLIKAWLPENLGRWTLRAASLMNANFRNYVAGQSIQAIILGVLTMLGMMALQIPYAPMVGAFVGVTALIPVVGGFIGAIVGGFMILTVDPTKALIFIIFLIVLQQLECNIIYPKIMGSKVNLPALWILAAVTVGGAAGGIGGMLIAVPVASTIYTLIKEATQRREQKKTKKE